MKPRQIRANIIPELLSSRERMEPPVASEPNIVPDLNHGMRALKRKATGQYRSHKGIAPRWRCPINYMNRALVWPLEDDERPFEWNAMKNPIPVLRVDVDGACVYTAPIL